MNNREKAIEIYKKATSDEDMRALALNDLFYLLMVVMGRKDMNKDWIFDRCREVAAEPNGCLDLWAREHYKSTIITVGLTIQDILRNPNVTIGIFSHTRPNAKAFLRQIKREFEGNKLLQHLFPHVCPPSRGDSSRAWSEDSGIIVKRDGNPKEATIEAWGVVDGQPTGKHFDILIYDDIVTLENVSTPEQINKTTDAWRLSLNLGARGGSMRMIGTRYHAYDTYQQLIEQGSVKVRIYTATEDGTDSGIPVLLSKSELEKKRRDMGPYVFACQMLQNPLQDGKQNFKKDWIKTWLPTTEHIKNMNIAIYVDPANAKKKDSDYTVMWVIGRGDDGNYYIIDGIRDRLNLTERCEKFFSLVRAYNPMFTVYEKYGIQADIDYINREMTLKNYHFPIIEVGGSMAKEDRIKRLIPLFENSNIFMPSVVTFIDSQGSWRDIIKEFIEEEYSVFPVSKHDDMLDCLARIIDKPIPEPKNIYRGAGQSYIEELPKRLEYNIFSGEDYGYDIFQ